jgi:hypothetical protein
MEMVVDVPIVVHQVEGGDVGESIEEVMKKKGLFDPI